MDPTLSGKILASRVYPEFFSVGAEDVVLHAGCGDGAQVLAYGQSGKRVLCVDAQETRVKNTLRNAQAARIANVEGCQADLEALPFADGIFDKIVAIDIIQHVRHPKHVFAEFRRVLQPGGELLITFPALQHYWLTRISQWKRGREKSLDSVALRSGHFSATSAAEKWDPDKFNHNLPLSEWLGIGEQSDLLLIRSHATTLFPPLHRYGIPRFWFSNNFIHRIDYFFGGLPILKNFGQARMTLYRKYPAK